MNKGQFKKGQSGNPKGRPKKGTTMTDLLVVELQRLRKISPKNKKMLSGKILLLRRMVDAALSGNPIIQKYICDRIDGFPVQAIDAEIDTTYKVGKPKELKPKPKRKPRKRAKPKPKPRSKKK